MAIVNGYCTLAEAKAFAGITDERIDAVLEGRIEAASRAIDNYCGRVFYQETAVTKILTAQAYHILEVPDLLSITTLQTDDGTRAWNFTWSATDWEFGAYGPPYTEIYRTALSRYSFPIIPNSIRITGNWGYSSVPHAIREAALLHTMRAWKRKDAPFGIIGNEELGQLRTIGKLDPDAEAYLHSYRRFAGP